jgi:hypothetical protein
LEDKLNDAVEEAWDVLNISVLDKESVVVVLEKLVVLKEEVLQELTQQQTHILSMFSSIMKAQHDTANSIIRNLRA